MCFCVFVCERMHGSRGESPEGSDWKRTNITKCPLSEIKWALKEHKIRENVSILFSVPLTLFLLVLPPSEAVTLDICIITD